MSFTHSKGESLGTPLINLDGRLDASAVPSLELCIREEVVKGKRKILVDFKDLAYMSSSGMRLFLSLSRELRQIGGELYLFSMKEEIMDIIKMAGFEKILAIFPNQKEALAKL